MANIIISIKRRGNGFDVSCQVDIDDRDDTLANELAYRTSASVATHAMLKVNQMLNAKTEKEQKYVH
ncbi:hypothetical protein [Martelella alba]|uniref:Uncharacterized protein n=1 Tax=Martelella alba TaxID=2590451 RepID=A0ABY2SRY3_9HYPH|nr:hypothetical protein [Martelella alba]TKI08634.1 hypothetical protein FCN80_00855 [Martelella alba]